MPMMMMMMMVVVTNQAGIFGVKSVKQIDIVIAYPHRTTVMLRLHLNVFRFTNNPTIQTQRLLHTVPTCE